MGFSKRIKSVSLPTYAAFFFCTLYAVAATLVSLHRFWQYEVFYDSYGIFDSVIWQVSRLQMPTIDHIALGRLPIFADHFYPTVFLLSPLYWFTGRSEILEIVQALMVTGSGWVLYLIGKKVLNLPWLSFAVTVSYLMFVGLQNAIITDFHEITIATLPLMLTFWALAVDRKKLFFLFLLLTLGCKESMFLTGIAIGILLLITRNTWRREGIATIILSVVWGYVTTALIIPYFSHGIYLYAPKLPQAFSEYFTRFIDTPEKRRTLLFSFRSFLFLPLFSPATWPLLIQDYFVRFVPLDTGGRWTLGMHYNAQSAVLLAISSVYGLKNLQRFVRPRQIPMQRTKSGRQFSLILISSLLILNALYLHQRVLHGPLGLAYNKAFYAHTKNFVFLDTLIAQIPKTASVMTQSNLAVRFAHQRFFMLDINYDMIMPEYIVMDLRDGQNPNNFFGMHGKSIPDLLTRLSADPNYELIFDANSQKIYRRKNL